MICILYKSVIGGIDTVIFNLWIKTISKAKFFWRVYVPARKTVSSLPDRMFCHLMGIKPIFKSEFLVDNTAHDDIQWN